MPILQEAKLNAKKYGFVNFKDGSNGFACVKRGMIVMITLAKEKDDKFWLHVSASYADHLPAYAELKMVKDVFIGEDRKAIQVFPPKSEHYNLHDYCLHLWHCMDGDPVPDFRRAGMI